MTSHLYLTQYNMFEDLADKISAEYAYFKDSSRRIKQIARNLCGLRCEFCGSEELQPGAQGKLASEERIIYVNKATTKNQFSFEVACQIAHFLLHENQNHGGMDSTDYSDFFLRQVLVSKRGFIKKYDKERLRTKEAKQLASAILVPRSRLLQTAQKFDSIDEYAVKKLAYIFDVSGRMILSRIFSLAEYGDWINMATNWDSLHDLKFSLDLALTFKVQNSSPHQEILIKKRAESLITSERRVNENSEGGFQVSFFDLDLLKAEVR